MPRADPTDLFGEGGAVVARQRKQRTRGRGDAGEAAKPHRHGDERRHGVAGLRAKPLLEYGDYRRNLVALVVLGSQHAGNAFDGQRQRQHQEVADYARDPHGQDDTPGAVPAGIAGLFGHVRGSIEAGVGPLRLQQPQHESPPVEGAAIAIDRLKQERHRLSGARKKSANTTRATPAMWTATLRSFRIATRRMPY